MFRFNDGLRLIAALVFLFSAELRAQITPVTPIDPSIRVTPGNGTTPGTAALPPSLFGISGGGAVELGQTVTLIVSFNGTGADQSYSWRKNGTTIAGASAATLVISAVTTADAGTYTVTVSNTDGSSVASTDLTVKALAAPIITTQPRATVAQVGQAVIFSFTATGSFPRTYQWRKDNANLPGGTQASYTIAAVTIGDAANYSVVVTNSEGSATSLSASLTVNAATPPVVSSSSPFDVTTTLGSQVTLSSSLNSGSSPFTYQWMKNGSVIPGATGSALTFASVALADSGRYSFTVTNVAGTATSREATLTVNPPTPITIFSHPQSQTVFQGQSISFNLSLNGSSPITYQWQKNGTPIAGATFSSYSINAAALADAGSYTVVITNPAGTVTSNAAVLTVNPPVAPTITSQPTSQNVPFNGSVNLSVQANGSPPLTYAWKKDGVTISGATSSNYFVSTATPAQSGVYTAVVSNGAGATTSNAVTVTVAAATLPTISTQPTDKPVSVGLSASFSVNVNTSGAGQLTVQWVKDGVPIAGATSTSYFINAVRESDAGSYRVVITGSAGSVTSTAAKLTVLPPAPPSVSWSAGDHTVTLGNSDSLNFGSVQGTGPFSYQWFKNGVAIPGATNATLNFPRLATSDLGTYTLTISNDGGLVTSPPIRVTVSPYSSANAATPWLDAGRVGDIVYFLATLPARIERYDLVGERWLATTLLGETQVPTAFLPTTEGVYVAYGRVLVRRSLDLATETPLTNVAASISHLFVFENLLYHNGVVGSSFSFNYATLNRSSLQAGPTVRLGTYTYGYQQVSLAPSLRKGFGRSQGISPGDIDVFTIAADGSINGSVDSPYHGVMLPASRTFVFPGDQFVADDSGTVYRTTDLIYVGALGGAFNDLAFLSDGTPVVLRDQVLSLVRPDNFIETARVTLPQGSVRLFVRGTSVFTFGAGASTAGTYTATKTATSAFAPAAPQPPVSAPADRISVDDAFLGVDNVVHLFSRSAQGLVRWSANSRSYLSTIPLRDSPALAFHQPGNPRALFAYPSGEITELALSAAANSERTIGVVAHRVRALVDLGDMISLNLPDAQDSGDFRMVIGANGSYRSITQQNLYYGNGVAWLGATRRFYSQAAFSTNGIQYEAVPTTGVLPSIFGTTIPSTNNATPPLRFNPEGTLFATANGRVFNADLAQVGVLANDVLDAAWLPTGLFTLRSLDGQAQVQQWSRVTYLQNATLSLRGTPIRIFALSTTQLVVVTSVQGYPSFNILNADLSVSPPLNAAGFAGVYFGKLGVNGTAGDFALYLRSDRTGVLLVALASPRVALLATDVVLGSDSAFIVSARDLAASVSRTVAGNVSADGSVLGSIPSLGLAFAGTKSSGAAASFGFYQAPAINGTSGNAYAIVAPDGRALLIAQNSSAADGGTGTLDSTARITITTSTGARLTAVLNAASGTLTATADRDSFATTTFSGLRDGIAHTDRLANISTRGRAGTGSDMMTAGFVISGTAPRQILVRAIGPTLGAFGISSFLAKPHLVLYHGNTALGISDSWGASPRANEITAASLQVGAFALAAGSADAAILTTLDPGDYTAQVTSTDGTAGTVLVEVYDAGSGTAATVPRLINIATLGRVTSDDSIVAGIVVSGNVPKRVLVRAVGPTLGTIGVGGVLADPVLTIYSGSTVICTNDDWGIASSASSPTDVALAAAATGGFPLNFNSRDAAILLTLQPGNYTAQISGKGGATGVALVEVYEVNN